VLRYRQESVYLSGSAATALNPDKAEGIAIERIAKIICK
jgi:hypothetical protein